MIRNWRKSLTGTLALAGVLAMGGCLKPEEYPVEPVIEFQKFEILGDSARVIFKFTDGDGDIGLSDNETSPPYDTSSIFYNNVFVRYYEKVNGTFQPGVNSEGQPVVFTYRTRRLTPTGKNKALKGTMIIYLVPFYYNPFSPDNDTLRYDIQIADRELHLSNVVQSNEVVR